MPTRIPGVGGVQVTGGARAPDPERDPSRNPSAPTASGGWRPDEPFKPVEGVKITIKRARGLTPQGILRVPFRFQSPVTDELRRRWTHDFSTYTTISGGEQARDGGAQLDRLDLATMFVDEDYEWTAWNGVIDPQRMLAELRAIQDRGAPFRLTLTQSGLWGPKPLVNMVAVLTSIEPTQRGSGNVGTEFTAVSFLAIDHQRIKQKKARRPADRDQDRRHRLQDGDTLYKIARHYFKRTRIWRDIADANGITGVSPDDAAELAAWAKRHHRTSLALPALAKLDTIDLAGSIGVERL